MNRNHSVVESFCNDDYYSLHSQMGESIDELSLDTSDYSYDGYLTKSKRAPVPLFPFDTRNELSRCLDMPIRLRGETEYVVPTLWRSLRSPLQRIINLEHANNPEWVQYNTYLTVDYSDIARGVQQRHGGLHVDGFQGSRVDPKHAVTRNYIVSTNGGTKFYPQPFRVLDPEVFNVFEGFDLQVDSGPLTATEGVFHFMDAYMVHESGVAARNGSRAFIRVTYDVKKFDRLGNTRNTGLDYEWSMVKRDVWGTVCTPYPSDLV